MGSPYCDDRTLTMVARTWRGRYKGLDELAIENEAGGTRIFVHAKVGRRWASVEIEDIEIHAMRGDDNAFLRYIDDRVRTAWLSAGGGDALDIPFRIGLRSPKRLRIRREPGFSYPKVMT